MPLAEAKALLERGHRRSGRCGVERRVPTSPCPPPPQTGREKAEPSEAGEGATLRRGGQLSDAPLLEQPGSLSASAARFARHDFSADRRALQKLAAWCRRFSPIVGLDDAQQPDSLLLDIRGCSHLFRGERALADRIVQSLGGRGFSVRVAIADTVGAAWAVAHYREATDENARRTPASTRSSAIYVIEPAQQQEALRDLPVAALRLDADVIATLAQLDIRTIGRLLQLPRETLPARFGKELVERLDQALGDRGEQIVPERPAEPVAANWSFEHPTTELQVIERVLRRLIAQIVEPLRFRCEGVQQLRCALHCAGYKPVRFAVRLFQPSASTSHLRELVNVQLGRISLPSAVESVHVHAATTAPRAFSQPTLFANDANREESRELALLIDRLSGRLGVRSVLRPCVVPDAQPEHGSRYVPVIAEGANGKEAARRPEAAHKSAGSFSTRPLHLRRKPAAVQVMSVGPEGPPYRVRWNDTDHAVVRCWGPERIETGWWRRRHVCRDYYRVEIDTGQQLWLYRDARASIWLLHGTFE